MPSWNPSVLILHAVSLWSQFQWKTYRSSERGYSNPDASNLGSRELPGQNESSWGLESEHWLKFREFGPSSLEKFFVP